MVAKLNRLMAYEKGSPVTIVTRHKSHLTNSKRYIPNSTRFMTTKLGKVVAYDIGSLRTKSHDSLIK